jgi:uncharacterized protein (TIGR02147 family)
MNCYEYLDYKKCLREVLQAKRQSVGARFTYEKMAKACGIQKTYLSRVLNSDAAHLNEDQLYHAALFLGFGRDERRFMGLLRDFQKSTSTARRGELKAEIEQPREKKLRSEAYLASAKVEAGAPTELAAYFLDPAVLLTHMFLAIPRYRNEPRLIQEQLHLTTEKFADVLARLESLGMISLGKDGYRLVRDSLHLPSDSPLYPAYRMLQRMKAMERMQALDAPQSYNFSVLFTADEKARHEIRTRFLELLKDVEGVAGSAPDAEVYQMNFDLFDWSR